MQRSGGSPRSLDDCAATRSSTVQFSDVPRGEVKPGEVLKPAAAGTGLRAVQRVLRRRARQGVRRLPELRSAEPRGVGAAAAKVAREALAATRAVL